VYGPAVAVRFPGTALDAVFWDGDSAAAAPRLAALARASGGPVPAGGAARDAWVEATFIVGQDAAARGETARAADAVRRLLAVPPIDTEPLRTVTPGRYALLLDAQVAAATHRPDAAARLASLDSMMRLGPAGTTLRSVGNLVAAQLWDRLGDAAHAYAALWRTVRGPGPTLFASTYVRERARLAAQLGDRETAIREYRRYLSARGEVEPSLQRHVASVRAELARLERESAGR
jgi:hypothetical protein